jgi:hypothetical protein
MVSTTIRNQHPQVRKGRRYCRSISSKFRARPKLKFTSFNSKPEEDHDVTGNLYKEKQLRLHRRYAKLNVCGERYNVGCPEVLIYGRGSALQKSPLKCFLFPTTPDSFGNLDITDHMTCKNLVKFFIVVIYI